jgi:hypothetical protein
MKAFLIAAITAVALAGTGVASAQTNAGTDANVKAGKTHAGAKASVKKHHRSTTGAGVSTGIETRDNNASAKGSIIPGKDRLNSDAFIGAHGGN